MSEQINIFEFLASKGVDYIIAPINRLLDLVEEYYQRTSDKPFFSSQLLLLSRSIEENRNGTDAIRISMKALELVSTTVEDVSNLPSAKSDLR